VQEAESEKQKNQRAFKCKLAGWIRNVRLKRFVHGHFRLGGKGRNLDLLRGWWSGSGRGFAERSGQSAARFEFRHERRCFDQYSGGGWKRPYFKLVGSRSRVLSDNGLRPVELQIAAQSSSMPIYL
jgi:hypothetical protein